MKSKIPWDLTSIFSEHLNDDSDGEDGDEVEAYEASKKRLKVRQSLFIIHFYSCFCLNSK